MATSTRSEPTEESADDAERSGARRPTTRPRAGRSGRSGWRDPDAHILTHGFAPDVERRYTAQEVRTLNACNPSFSPRYECVRGRLLVTPSPGSPHQAVALRLARALGNYCEAHFADSETLLAPADITWGLRDTLVQPDVFVVPAEQARRADRVTRTRGSVAGWRQITQLLLAAEVLSPATRLEDETIKRPLYLARGTPLVWLLDVDARSVAVWMAGATEPLVERERLVWHPVGAPHACEIALDWLFGTR